MLKKKPVLTSPSVSSLYHPRHHNLSSTLPPRMLMLSLLYRSFDIPFIYTCSRNLTLPSFLILPFCPVNLWWSTSFDSLSSSSPSPLPFNIIRLVPCGVFCPPDSDQTIRPGRVFTLWSLLRWGWRGSDSSVVSILSLRMMVVFAKSSHWWINC